MRHTGGVAAGTVGAGAVTLDGLAADVRLLVLAKTASALADPVRLQILGLLRAHEEMTVGELTQELPVSQPRVSVHLRCLTDCGYTAVRREGRRSIYRLQGPQIVELLDAVQVHAASSLEGLLSCLACTPSGEPATGANTGSGCC
ncbi:metalloregulator ArsR/SmtB family transcription factor [Dermatophilaceae bacterium Soc4.6]